MSEHREEKTVMLVEKKHVFQPIIYGLCSMLLASLLVACGGGSGPDGNTPTPTPTLSPTPLPTPSPTPIGNLKTYTGDGYTIGYPQGWAVSKGSDGIISFNDSQGVAYLAITSQPNPQGAISSSKLVNAGLRVFQSQAKNYQQGSIAPTTTVAAETWSQGAATGDVTPEGQTSPVSTEVVVIADNHPAHALVTRGFTIAYGTDERAFDLAKTSAFQPMLQSFKFTV